MKQINTVGIIGFGVMGAAIGMNAATAGYDVIFKEVSEDLVKSMYDKWVTKALEKRVAAGKMTADDMNSIAGRIKGTDKYDDLQSCDLIIEAAVENLELKQGIFKTLSDTCPEDTILVTNTSTFLIKTVMAQVANQSRTAGLHYFFPANVNRLVEIIRQEKTNDETVAAIRQFAEKNRKTAISVKDFPGFAINPIFISSYMVLTSFYGDYNAATLDDISKKALGVKFGIMWVLNFSGMGTAYHAAESMNQYLKDTDVGFPEVPKPLENCFKNNEKWDLESGPVSEDSTSRQVVVDRLLGTIFTVATHLVEKDVVSVKDLDTGVCLSLAWPEGPFTLMNKLGMEKTRQLITQACASDQLHMPARFADSTPDPWDIG